MGTSETKPEEDHTKDQIRTTYSSLFHEVQYRATKNALMNYHQAEIYEEKGSIWKKITTALTGASASGILAGIAQKGKMLANRFGVAGLVGLPVCGVIELASSSTSELVPSYTERARKHAAAAAGWMRVAETARTEQLRMRMDPTYDLQQISQKYEELIQRREAISKEVLIPRGTHRHFQCNPEMVYLAMTRRSETYKEFLNLELKNKNSMTQIQNAEDIYF